MGVDKSPATVGTEELDEDNSDTEGTELSEGSSLNAQVGEDTGTTEP